MESQEILNEYEAAMFAANEIGYAGMTAEQVIRELSQRAEAAEAKIKSYSADLVLSVEEINKLQAKLAELVPDDLRDSFERFYQGLMGTPINVLRTLRSGSDYADTEGDRLNIAWKSYTAILRNIEETK